MGSSVIFKGTRGPVQVSSEIIVDPQTGNATRTIWEGSQLAIYGKLAQLQLGNKNVRIEVSHDGPKWQLTSTSQTVENTGEELPVDQWTLHTEAHNPSIWAFPAIRAWVNTSGNQGAKQIIEDTVKDGGTALTGSALNNGDLRGSSVGIGTLIWEELLSGVTGYEEGVHVVRRERVISPEYPIQLPVYDFMEIWSDAQISGLIASSGPLYNSLRFSIPTVSILPTTASPKNTIQGWKLRAQNSEFQGNKISQIHEWTLFNWSNLFYYSRA